MKDCDKRLRLFDIEFEPGSLKLIHLLAMNTLKRIAPFCVETKKNDSSTASHAKLCLFEDWLLNIASEPFKIENHATSDFGGPVWPKNNNPIKPLKEHPEASLFALRDAAFNLANLLAEQRCACSSVWAIDQKMIVAIDKAENELLFWLTSPERKRRKEVRFL